MEEGEKGEGVEGVGLGECMEGGKKEEVEYV